VTQRVKHEIVCDLCGHSAVNTAIVGKESDDFARPVGWSFRMVYSMAGPDKNKHLCPVCVTEVAKCVKLAPEKVKAPTDLPAGAVYLEQTSASEPVPGPIPGPES
jgi:hypothetical protein